ncbi:MAG: HEAT repeat domain-containing protein [Verrucomicrobiota bacterium]
MHLNIEKRDKSAPAKFSPEEAQIGLKKLKLPAGFEANLFAGEPMLANPVAFSIDEQGRVFVSETHRLSTSVIDIRNYMSMLDADLACRTVEDRLRMSEKFFGAEAKNLAGESEIIRFIEDLNGDGKADFSSVYADGFDTALDGIASGILARQGKVWFANIPNIWQLEGMDKSGHATSRKILSRGYGVRFSYIGHDLHGLIFGPDGKLYFSVGDRGANLTTMEGKNLFYPDEGAVFRCNPDGTELEVIHHGLRNPQELAFDEFGNLFTGDNDFDHGDHERWVNIVEGGDSGWRVGYQHPPLGYDYVPWMAEQLWVPHFEGQAAYIVPPITNISDGPSGLVYYPGTGLSEKWNGHFFLCQFKGSSAQSGIDTFSVKPKGASFELVNSQHFIENVLVTDVDFGPDSCLYFSDWTEGWGQTRKGRIYRVCESNPGSGLVVAQTKTLLAKGFANTSQSDLLLLMEHPNMRVRLEAQYAFAERGGKSVDSLVQLASNASANPRARRHAIWALGQIARKKPKVLTAIIPLLSDPDDEICVQSAKILGDARVSEAFSQMSLLLKHSNARVQFFAAQGLAKLKREEAVGSILEMLRANNDSDVYLRHAGVFALGECASLSQLIAAAKDESTAVRMATLLAMRRQSRPQIAGFLKDRDDLLVVEAARAINDLPINEAMPDLAALISSDKKFAAKFDKQFQALQLRIVNANSRIGGAENAKSLAAFAARENKTPAATAEALQVLGTWSNPGTRDRIVGVHRPFAAKRAASAAMQALEPQIGKILTGTQSEEVKLAAIEAARQLGLTNADASLYHVFSAGNDSDKVRLASLKTLGDWKSASVTDAIKLAQTSTNESIRAEGNRLATEANPDTAVSQIQGILAKGSVTEKQTSIASLGAIPGAEADKMLSDLLDQLLTGHLQKGVEIELLEAAAQRSAPQIKEKLAQYRAKEKDNLGGYRETLFGGNGDAGKKIFFERPEASCVRCHKINNEGGDIGPQLAGVGSRQTREYILESLIAPNAKIAPGFETVLVSMKNGTSYAGVFKSETDTELVLNSPEDGLTTIAKENIKTRNRGMSGMPEGLAQILSKRDLRNLVEFLATVK